MSMEQLLLPPAQGRFCRGRCRASRGGRDRWAAWVLEADGLLIVPTGGAAAAAAGAGAAGLAALSGRAASSK